ncbi:hypothetical protein T12_13348 [Trichinella patagoniensis]|uniref:Uncharacterized protein n=1 Tax=Trichinella patagoniensis TaxID=990121 RepID=A0A0V1AC74_9BILA|nr:hypothetical protein T12_13348 [Trichinella patagoniensis]
MLRASCLPASRLCPCIVMSGPLAAAMKCYRVEGKLLQQECRFVVTQDFPGGQEHYRATTMLLVPCFAPHNSALQTDKNIWISYPWYIFSEALISNDKKGFCAKQSVEQHRLEEIKCKSKLQE